MNIVKNTLCNQMGDLWMNDCLVAYFEKDIFNSIKDEAIMQQFQNMKTRRGYHASIYFSFFNICKRPLLNQNPGFTTNEKLNNCSLW